MEAGKQWPKGLEEPKGRIAADLQLAPGRALDVMNDDVCFFYEQKAAYEIVSGDWSSDVCSSDLSGAASNSSATSHISAVDQSAGCSCTAASSMQERSEERRVGKECLTQCRSR